METKSYHTKELRVNIEDSAEALRKLSFRRFPWTEKLSPVDRFDHGRRSVKQFFRVINFEYRKLLTR